MAKPAHNAQKTESGAATGRAGGLPGFGIAALAATLPLAALAVGERAGLPGPLAWMIGFLLVASATMAAVWMSRTSVEPVFLGRTALLRPLAAGVLLGLLSGAAVFHVVRPTASRELAAVILGSALGLAVAHGMARLRLGSRLLLGEAPAGEDGAPSLVHGLLVAAAGLLVAHASLPAARDAMALLSGWGQTASLAAVLAAPAAAIAIGGLRGLLAFAGALCCLIGAGLALTLGLGLIHLGAPPLPGLSQPETLLAIAGARTRLFHSDALPFLAAFVPPDGATALVFSGAFLGAALIAGLLGRAATPGVELARPGALLAGVAAQALLLFGLAAMAGYAVEAAGLQFVGASLQTPPPGLLEAARQGLAEFCGTRPDNLDALRAACGLAPRAVGQLDIGRIRLAEPFLWTGAPVAFGVPSALAAPARMGPVAFPILALSAGLWLAALGLGRSVLGRGRVAPGLASHRLGLVRVAALAAAGGLAAAVAGWPELKAGWPTVALLSCLALGLDALQRRPGAAAAAAADQRAAMMRTRAAPRHTAQTA